MVIILRCFVYTRDTTNKCFGSDFVLIQTVLGNLINLEKIIIAFQEFLLLEVGNVSCHFNKLT